MSPRTGTTLLELMVVLAILAVAMGMYATMVVATTRQSAINRENAMAAEAIRVTLERLRSEDFAGVYALYNQNPDDDPAGAGSAPGARFLVAGLDPLPNAADGLAGEIVFPETVSTQVAPPEWNLREDFDDAALGMPRDLDGDSRIDQEDHAGDYLFLPVHVRVSWQGSLGARSLSIYTMLTEIQT